MKNLRLGFTVLLAACLGARGASQGSPDGLSPLSGTWRADSVPGWASGWTVVLKTSGSSASGAVTNCPRGGAVNITDATVVDTTLRFKCRSEDGESVISFVGALQRDEIRGARATTAPPTPHRRRRTRGRCAPRRGMCARWRGRSVGRAQRRRRRPSGGTATARRGGSRRDPRRNEMQTPHTTARRPGCEHRKR